MKLSHFESYEHVMPNVSGEERATKTFVAGQNGVEFIDCHAAGTLVIVRRDRKPDIYFTPMGYGTLLLDSPIPANRTGNQAAEDEQPRKGKNR